MSNVMLRIIMKRKALVSAIVGGVTLLTLSASLVIPPTFEAEAAILPRREADDMSAMFGGLASSLSGMIPFGGMGALGGDEKVQDLVDILESRTLADRLIEKLQLDQEFKSWRTRDELVRKVRKSLDVSPPGLKRNVIFVRATAKDPKLAASLANEAVDQLGRIVNETGYSDATRSRRFLEEELAKVKAELSETEQKLADFQAKNGLVSLPDTVSVMLKTLAELEAKQVESSSELSGLEQSTGALAKKIDSFQADPNRLVDLEIRQKGLQAQQQALSKAHSKFLGQLSSLPPKGMALARLQRDLQVRNAVYLVLTQQHQMALIAEGKEAMPFLSLDKAVVPEDPVFPKPLPMTLLAFVVSLCFALSLAFWLESRGLKDASA